MSEVMGAVLAGGRSRRFGADKALAEVGGVRMVERIHATLAQVAREVVLVTDRPGRFGELGLPAIVDRHPGRGPLAGVHAALHWARDRSAAGVLLVACDTPFVPAALLEALAAEASRGSADAVVPQSGGPRGIEPLCAWYSVRALDAVRVRLAADRPSPRLLLAELRTTVLPLDEVRRFGDPAALFLNVNTPDEHRRAEELAPRRAAPSPPTGTA